MTTAHILKRIFTILVAGMLAFAIGSIATQAQSAADRTKASARMEEGDNAFEVKDFAGALAHYEAAKKLLPKSPAANFNIGKAAYFLGNYPIAAEALDEALRLGYNAAEVHRIRWSAYQKLKRYDEAIADLNALNTAEPVEGYDLAVAEMSLEKGDFQNAAAGYRKLILASPTAGDLYYQLARSLAGLKDIDGQASAAEAAIRNNTMHLAESYMIVARARDEQKRIPEAIDAYARALSAKPDKVEAYRRLADLYRSQDRLDEAIAIANEGRRNYGQNGLIYADLSLLYSLQMDYDRAIETARSAVQLLPQEPIGHVRLCRAFFLAGRGELAVSSCNNALKLSPKDGETLFYLGRANEVLGNAAEAEKRYREAIVSLRELIRSDPSSADAYYLLGGAYSELKENAKSIDAYKRTLELNPRYKNAVYNLGVLYIQGADKESAMQQYRALLPVDAKLAGVLKTSIDTKWPAPKAQTR